MLTDCAKDSVPYLLATAANRSRIKRESEYNIVLSLTNITMFYVYGCYVGLLPAEWCRSFPRLCDVRRPTVLRLQRSDNALLRLSDHLHALLLPAAHAVVAPARHRVALPAVRDFAADPRTDAVPSPQDDRCPAAAAGVQVAGPRVFRLPGQRAGPAAVGPRAGLRLGRVAAGACRRDLLVPQDQPAAGPDVQRCRGGPCGSADARSRASDPALSLCAVIAHSGARQSQKEIDGMLLISWGMLLPRIGEIG